MYRGTTPKIVLETMDELDLNDYSKIHVTISNNNNSRTFDESEMNVEAKKITIVLSQEETLAFNAGKVQVQIRCATSSGLAYASNIMTADMNDILEEGVL